ncbi:SPDY domain-containing protein [Streptomyces variabilis]
MLPDPLPDPFKDLDPAQTVRVLPRHLAGYGQADLEAIWPFPFDDGWHLHQGLEGMVFAISPCARLWTRFAPKPEERGQGTWTIGMDHVPFGPRAWEITFNGTTPAELLRDVHTELLDLYLEDRYSDQDHLFEDATAAHEVYTPLLARGWSHSIKTDGTQTFLPPEGLGGVRHRYATTGSDSPIWRAWGGYPSEPQWQARFSAGAPTTLAAAFTASLISTEPVHRAVKEIPFHTRRHLYVAPAAAPQPPSYPTPALPPANHAVGRTR